jgi:hypothetical protein
MKEIERRAVDNRIMHNNVTNSLNEAGVFRGFRFKAKDGWFER